MVEGEGEREGEGFVVEGALPEVEDFEEGEGEDIGEEVEEGTEEGEGEGATGEEGEEGEEGEDQTVSGEHMYSYS